jgi:hypothetical protein
MGFERAQGSPGGPHLIASNQIVLDIAVVSNPGDDEGVFGCMDEDPAAEGSCLTSDAGPKSRPMMPRSTSPAAELAELTPPASPARPIGAHTGSGGSQDHGGSQHHAQSNRQSNHPAQGEAARDGDALAQSLGSSISSSLPRRSAPNSHLLAHISLSDETERRRAVSLADEDLAARSSALSPTKLLGDPELYVVI